MDLPPFLLTEWLTQNSFGGRTVEHNLASGTGPAWTIEELRRLPRGDLDIEQSLLSYAPPDGSRELRKVIANAYEVDPDWVIVTTGASEALLILFCIASQPGANAVLPSPGFPAFAALAGAWGVAVNHYRLTRQSRFEQSAANVLRAVDPETVLALVNTPHNPTGSVMNPNETFELAEALGARGIPLVVDEVYHGLYFGRDQGSAAGTENVIVIGDMSKSMSLPGLRLGWIIDADAERRKRIVRARSYYTICSSPLSEAIAIHALRNRGALLERLNEVASANLGFLHKAMSELTGVLDWVPPGGGATCFPWFVDGRDSRPICEKLADHGLLLAPGDCFDEPPHMRLGYCSDADSFARAIDVMVSALRE